jgi:hypothetical protein
MGLRTRQFKLQSGTKKESTAKFGGVEKYLQEGKHSTKLKTPLS